MTRISDDRPLTWDTLTLASKIMLPVYVAAALYIGACYLFSPAARLRSPSLTVARQLLTMDAWGLIAWALAVILIVCIFITGHRQVAIFSLCVGAVAYLAWSGFYAAAIFLNPQASLVGPMWPFIAAAAHVASAVSLTRREP